jgi:hypothetical protein
MRGIWKIIFSVPIMTDTRDLDYSKGRTKADIFTWLISTLIMIESQGTIRFSIGDVRVVSGINWLVDDDRARCKSRWKSWTTILMCIPLSMILEIGTATVNKALLITSIGASLFFACRFLSSLFVSYSKSVFLPWYPQLFWSLMKGRMQ